MSPAESGSILLERVLLKVSPDIFCHPIWIHFLESGFSPSANLIKDLLDSAHYYKEKKDIISSCQILLICACLLKRINKLPEALETIQEAWNLAKINGSRQILLWSSWGGASISIHQGDRFRATHYLDTMQEVVNQDNDWIFTDVLELLKRSLAKEEEEIGTLKVLVDWLNRWGESPCKHLSGFQGENEVGRGLPGAPLLDNFEHLALRWWKALFQRIGESIPLRRLSKLSPVPQTTACLHEAQDQIPRFAKPPYLSEQESSGIEAFALQPVRTFESDLHRIEQPQKNNPSAKPSLAVYCLGKFRVYQDDKLITNWPSGKGKAILKYLTTNGNHPVPKDVLMDIFWRDAEPESARNNLNVAIYGLRQALRADRSDFSHIIFQDDCYQLNPAMNLWIDIVEFLRCYENGQNLMRTGGLIKAISEFEKAINLYQGDLFEEDLYEDWPIPQRENLKDSYLLVLDRMSRYYFEIKNFAVAANLCQKILAKDACREDAHRRLMKCYSHQGQRNLALRQYHLCVEALKFTLEVPPSQETTELYRQIRNDLG